MIDNFAIQKLSFLTELNGRKASLNVAYWKFFRYTWGPYSAVLANDVAHLERFGFLHPESRELTDKARYLCNYVRPEIDRSSDALTALGVATKTLAAWGSYRGWHIVDKVYELTVPVDGLGGQAMLVKDIPMKTDILVPECSNGSDVQPFSAEIIEDIQSELLLPPAQLDPSSEELWTSVSHSLEAAFSR